MRYQTCILSATLASIIGFAGCTNDAVHSQYPDQSAATRTQVQAIRDDAQQRNAVIDRDLEQRLTTLSFRTSQAEEKAKQECEQIAIDLNKDILPLKAKQDEAKTAGERERDRIDHEGDGLPANANHEEVIRIKADADVRKAKSLRTAGDIIADIDAKILICRSQSAKRVAKVDESLATDKVAIDRERTEAKQQARERTLAVSIETTGKLDQLGVKSAEHRDELSKQEAEAERQDQHITSAVRKAIDRGDSARDVMVSTHGGAVTLTGMVSSEAIRHDIIADATKVVGVVKVDDKLSIR